MITVEKSMDNPQEEAPSTLDYSLFNVAASSDYLASCGMLISE
jgi:hypothetical protein